MLPLHIALPRYIIATMVYVSQNQCFTNCSQTISDINNHDPIRTRK